MTDVAAGALDELAQVTQELEACTVGVSPAVTEVETVYTRQAEDAGKSPGQVGVGGRLSSGVPAGAPDAAGLSSGEPAAAASPAGVPVDLGISSEVPAETVSPAEGVADEGGGGRPHGPRT